MKHVLFLLCLFGLFHARATSLTWDADPATPGAQDGAGAWTVAATNWFDGIANTNWNSTTPDVAVFGAANGPAGTVTVGGSHVLGGLTFAPVDSGEYTISGGTLVLSNNPTIEVATNATVASTLIGSGVGLVKTGPAVLTLSGGGISYSGPTRVDGGTLVLSNATAFASAALTNPASTVSIYQGGLGATVVTGMLSGAGTYVVDGPGGGSIYQNRVILRGNGSDNTGPVRVINAGKLWLDRPVNAIGDASVVHIGSTNASFSIYQGLAETIGGLNGVGNVYGGDAAGISALTVGGGDASAAYSGVIQNASSTLALTKIGLGTQTLVGASTYSGGTTVNGGVLALGGANDGLSRVGSGPLTINAGGTVLSVAFNVLGYDSSTVTPGVVINGGTWNAQGNDASFRTLTMNGGSLLRTGGFWYFNQAGAITVTGGAAVIAGGQMRLRPAGGVAMPITVLAGATLSVSATLANDSGVAGFAKAGPGALVLSATNTYAGNTWVSNGVLALSGGGSISNSPVLALDTNGVLDVSATAFSLGRSQTLQGYGAVTGGFAAADGAKLQPGAAGIAGTLTFNGSVMFGAGTTNLFDLTSGTNVGAGVNDLMVINGDLAPGGSVIAINQLAPLSNGVYRLFTYTGSKSSTFNPALLGVAGTSRRSVALEETNTAGQVNLVVAGELANLTWNSSSDDLWDVGGRTNWLNPFGGSNDVYVETDYVTFDDRPGVVTTVTLNTSVAPSRVSVHTSTNAFVLTGNGKLTGTAGLIKDGTNAFTLALSGSNDFSGPVSIAAGTVVVGGSGGAPLGTGIVSNDGALVFRRDDAFSFVNPTVGTGLLRQAGSGVLSFSNLLAYSGPIVVSSGTLSFARSTDITYALAAISNDATVYCYPSGNGAVFLGARLSGPGLIQVDGPGGGTVFQNRVVLRGNGSDHSGAVTVLNNGRLWLDRSVNAISDVAVVHVSTNAGLYLFAAAGSDVWGGYQVAETIGGLTGSGNVYGQWQNGAVAPLLTVGGGDVSATFAGSISEYPGTLAGLKLIKIGSGTQTLNGASTWSGGITVSNGVLALGHDAAAGIGTLTLGGGTLVAAGGTRVLLNPVKLAADSFVDTSGGDLVLAGALFDAAALVKQGAGTLSLGGLSTNTGALLVSNGTLLVHGNSGTGGLVVASGATLGGTGVVRGAVTQDGVIAPGAGIGTLTISNQVTDGVTAVYRFELGGTNAPTDYDQLVVSDVHTLQGTLDVVVTNGYVPASGDRFTILTNSGLGGLLFGTFTTVSAPALASGLGWEVQYTGTESASLVVTGTVSGGLSAYEQWAQSITNPALRGEQADADGDGYANLLEYSQGTDATNSADNAKLSLLRTNGQFLVLFNRVNSATDIVYEVEGAYLPTNNALWLGIATNVIGSWGGSTNVNDNNTAAVHRVLVTDLLIGTNRSLRLKVTRP